MNRHAKASSAGSSTRGGNRLGAIVRGAFATRAPFGDAQGSSAPSRRLGLALMTVLGTLTLLLATSALADVAEVTIDPVDTGSVTATEATLEGTVNPQGSQTTWYFEYRTAGSSDWFQTPAEGAGGGSSPVSVEAEIEELQPGVEYEARLHAFNDDGEATSPLPNPTFTTAAAKPSVETQPPLPLRPTEATLNGTVNPNNSPTEYWFEWGSEDCSAISSPCTALPLGEDGVAGSAYDTGHVAAQLGTEVNEVQTIEFSGSPTGGEFTLEFEGEEATVEMPGPDTRGLLWIKVQRALEALPAIGEGNVHASERIGALVAVEFAGPLAATDVPLIACDGAALSGGSSPSCSASQQDPYSTPALSPETTYHYRLLAKNTSGITAGDDVSFTTPAVPSCANQTRREEQHATFLPDCRAYELVSPPAKNGNDVMPSSYRVQTSASGDAVTFSSLGGFSDARGSGVGFEYVAERDIGSSAQGWATHAVTPQAHYQELVNTILGGGETYYPGGFSSDLSCAFLKTNRPLPGHPGVPGLPNLYLRSDFLDPGAGNYTLLTENSAAPIMPSFSNTNATPKLRGYSNDCSHVLFESSLKLLPEAGSGAKLYEWSEGALHLAAVLPDNSLAASAAAATNSGYAGGALTTVVHTMSEDGSRYFFQAPASNSGGEIYMRENDTETVQINASEKGVPDTPEPAAMQLATPDGSRAFFATKEALLDSDTNPGEDLYMYDAEAATGSHLTRISNGIGGGGFHVVGTSDDGHYVYFYGDGTVLANHPMDISTWGLYLWHDGHLRLIGSDAPAVNENSRGASVINNVPGFGLAQHYEARVSSDGSHLLFRSSNSAGFVGRDGYGGYDHGSPALDGPCEGLCAEFFLYSADADTFACVSCNPFTSTPRPKTQGNAVGNIIESPGATNTRPYPPRLLTADAGRVFFSTPESLLPDDTNGRYDAYEYDVSTGTVHLLSSGTWPSDSYFLGASPSGDDVFIDTTQRLVGWDRDGNYDLYDVRVGGGVAEPPVIAGTCEGESCRSGAGTPPPPASNASASLVGRGNPVPKRCPSSRRLVRSGGKPRCVPKHRHGRKHHRTANQTGRNGR